MISLLGSKKAAFGPPGCTLVIKIQKSTNTNKYIYKYKIQKYNGRMISAVRSQKEAFGPLNCTLVMKIRNTKKIQIQLQKIQKYKVLH